MLCPLLLPGAPVSTPCSVQGVGAGMWTCVGCALVGRYR